MSEQPQLSQEREEMIIRAALQAGVQGDAFVAYYLTSSVSRNEGFSELVSMAIDWNREEQESI